MIVYSGRFRQRYAGPVQPFEGVIVWRSFGSGGAIPTPTPTPVATARPGGTSHQKRSLPQYYSRQFFGRDVQLPQDDIAHQVAEQVLEQAEGVLEDLVTDPAYDELLNTVDQLARIVASHIESRGVYEAVEGVRRAVQIKKDAEIRELVLAAEEEGEVKEIMELL